MDSGRPTQISTLVDLKDPIQVHLLTETALSDSKEYEILSQEEVDDLKKQVQSLIQRVEQTRANLTIQSKYRDAAISMAKLYSPTGAKRRSVLGDRGRGEEDAREAELERRASERRCDELTAELFSLEKRLTDSQKRLLQHTAGILQMTHRASSKKLNQPSNSQPLPNGIPGSPESLYTSNDRDSMEAAGDDIYFEGRSLYLPLDQVDSQPSRQPRKNMIEIPMKSPVREQQNQLREETDRLRDENLRLNTEAESLRKEGAQRIEFIADTERKLEDLTNKLRDMVTRFNPAGNQGGSLEPPSRLTNGSSSDSEPGAMVGRQLDYLEKGLAVALEEQGLELSESRKETERATAAAATTLAQTEDKIGALNRQVHDALRNMEPDYPSPPAPSGSGLTDQLDYLQDSFRTVQTQLSRAAELSSSATAEKQKNEQFEAVLMGLWDIIQTGYAEIRQQETERRKARAEKGLEDDDADLSSDESLMNTDEPYSLQSFSTKVQWLYAQATSLREQKTVLKRQIKQQRELNNKSSSEKDTELGQKIDELRRIQDLLNTNEREARDTQDKLDRALDDLDTLQRTSAANESAAAQAAQDQLKERDVKIASLESDTKDLESKLLEVEASIAATQAQLAQTNEEKTLAEAEAYKLQKVIKDKDAEIERMNIMVVELKTEATIAKAELDGAYGSRAQRAAEAAALTKNSEESELATEVGKLKNELAGILRELEDMTKETIIAEKEKLELESKLDEVQAAKTGLEEEVNNLRDKLDNDVSRLQEQLDAERLKVTPGPGGQNSQPRAGASMLSEQFRATMKEERRKFQEEIRVCLLPTPACR
jgi:hypothetical protein